MQAVLVPLLLMSLVAEFGLILFSITRTDRKRSIDITLLSFFLFIYTLGYLAEIISNDANSALTAIYVENFGIPFIVPMFFLAILDLFWAQSVKWWYRPAALLYGFGVALTVLTNEAHHLYYTSITMVLNGDTNFAVLGRGPLYALNQIVIACLALAGFIMVAKRYFTSGKRLRHQIICMAAGTALSVAANIMNVFKMLPPGLDLTPIAIAVGTIVFTVVLYQSNLTDVVVTALDTAVDEMNDAIVVLDESGAFLHGNRTALALFPGLKTYTVTAPIAKLDEWPQQLSHLDANECMRLSLQTGENGTEIYDVDVKKMFGRHKKHIGWSVIFKNVTDITNLMQELERHASIDFLTGILNRREFFVQAQQRLLETRGTRETGEIVALILFDIDMFKKVNDTYGHLAGDEVLRAVTGAVRRVLREQDVFGRLGGEEFVMLVEGIEGERLMEFATSLREAVMASGATYEGNRLSITASFGVTVIEKFSTLDEAIKDADLAMYEAKKNGRNRVVLSCPGGGAFAAW